MDSGQRWVWTGRTLLVALVATNVLFLFLARTNGPLIGTLFYAILLIVGYRWSDRREILVGGLVGLGVHMAEVALLGWSPYPILMALNLILPAALVLVTGAAGQRAHQD